MRVVAFTRALYYPWIDVNDESWLKNALLYWEYIHTIVPFSHSTPYVKNTSREFSNEGLLVPYYIDSRSNEVTSLKKQVMEYLETEEATRVLFEEEMTHFDMIHSEKLPYDIEEIVRIHPQKLPYSIRQQLKLRQTEDGFVPVNRRFANYYMTLLAANISNVSGLGLLSEEVTHQQLAHSVRLDANINVIKQRMRFSRARQMRDSIRLQDCNTSKQLAQGMLADLIIDGVKIDPETPVKKIIKFRKDFADELGLLRQKVEELTNSISTEMPMDHLRQNILDIYTNQVCPAINNHRRALKDSNIKWMTDTLLKVSVLSVGTTTILPTFGVSMPQALLTVAGASLVGNGILYNIEKKSNLRNNPFTYVFKANKRLGY